MLSVLLLGFLVGLQHAMEADHLAAVASLATRSNSLMATVRQGAIWGLGHTLTLVFFGGAVLLAGRMVPGDLAAALELAVGIMLILLGLDVLRRVAQKRIHFHLHSHEGNTHFHAHGHPLRIDHASDPHDHTHTERFPFRALLVGMVHGMAGSAALIILVLQTVASPWQGLAYIGLFGLGSVFGMAILAAIISIPLRVSARRLTWAHNGIEGLVGIVSVAVGVSILFQADVVTCLIR